MSDRIKCAVVGAGPAGLMAADVLSAEGHAVTVFEAKPSVARKFLMAGKSGLNLTIEAPDTAFLAAFAEAAPHLAPMIGAMGPDAVRAWTEALGQETFAGSSGRVFPRAMKASPLLRAWLARLQTKGVQIETRHRWLGWEDETLLFETPEGERRVAADATVLALGGASWSRLGSDGAWKDVFQRQNIQTTPFGPANVALELPWSDHMAPFFGQPVKAIGLRAGPFVSRGECVITGCGLEGGGIYSVSRGVRAGHVLTLDLKPDLDAETLNDRLAAQPKRLSQSARLRRALRLSDVQVALLNEFGRPLPQGLSLASLIKALPLSDATLGPMDGAISTSGGASWDALTPNLMLKSQPGVFCAGEMLDWEAPTWGYLITGCLATGAWAGQAAARWMDDVSG